MAAGEEDVSQELAELMTKLKLTPYLPKAEKWRQEMGAATLDEIRENLDDFIGNLELKPLEIRRLKKYFTDLADGPPSGAGYSAASQPPAAAPVSVPPQAGVTGRFGDGYVRYEELGSGATATVYRCTKESKPGEVFAVKMINLKSLSLQPEFKRLSQVLQREMQILYGLKHPRIVSLFDVIEQPDCLCLVMEFVSDGELFDYVVKRGTLTEPGSRNVFCQIVDALKYIHSKDIVYRDLKPENILVHGKGATETALQIKLSDFGHSKLVNDGYSTALTRVGTPQYWAPEVSDPRLAARGYDYRVDLWSLGVVLYVMLMGAYPFDGVSAPIERQIQNPRLTFMSPVTGRICSEHARTLLSSLIKVQANARLSLEDCLKHPWTANTSVVPTSVDDRQEYCSLELAIRPSKSQRDGMVKDLLGFQQKFKCFVQVRRDQVVANLSSLTPAQAEDAKSDLRGIIKYHLSIDAVPKNVQSVAPPAEDDGASFKLHTTNLCVGPEGAGIDLIPDVNGMLVQQVCPNPGQPGLRPSDIITKINEIPLSGSPEAVEAIFGQYFHDGVQVSVKRPNRA